MFDLADVLKNVPESGTGREQIRYIPLALIDPDPKNFYQMSKLSDLADNIALCGLQQPIRVRPQPGTGRFTVVSGHRRREALKLLVSEGQEKFSSVPCIIERDQISPAMQQLRLIYANLSTRAMTAAELAEQAEQVEQLLYQLQEEGYDFPGRMRDHVAQAVGASKSKLSRLKVIRQRLDECWLDAWQDDKLPEATAYALAQMKPEWQQAIWSHWKNHINQLTEASIHRFQPAFARIENLRCPGHDSCIHTAVMIDANAKNQWSSPCTICCKNCPCLVSCKHPCPLAKEKQTEKRAAARAAENEARAKQERKNQPYQDFAKLVYARVGQARKANRVSVRKLYESQKRMYDGTPAEVSQTKLEAGEGEFGPSAYLPFGYTFTVTTAMTLCTVADTLGCSIDYLFGRTDRMEVVPESGTEGGV